jgi:hypothetical protein
MIRYNRRNTIWLAALSILMALVLISEVSASVQALLLAVFTLALAGTFINAATRKQVAQAVRQRSPLSRTRISSQAREAVERASNRGYLSSDIQLADIGLIASQTGNDGLVMRRTRSISKDDDGVRPYIILNVPAHESDRNATIRFALIDQNGKEQYIREMSVYLRDGEMNILADNHMPLISNDHIGGMGDWDLRVTIDGSLAGVHGFSLTASADERRQRLRRGAGQYFVAESENDSDSDAIRVREDVPLSLEELLRNQNAQNARDRS